MPEYLKLRNAVLIVDPKDRAGLEGGGLQTPLVRDRGSLFGRHSREGGSKTLCA